MSVRTLSVLLACAVLACGGPSVPDGGDAARDGARSDVVPDGLADVTDVSAPPDVRITCATDRDCANGVYCDGIERCLPTSPDADARGCTVAAHGPCGDATCNEAGRSCDAPCPPEGSLGTCQADTECDDHVFCNGTESCTAGFCVRAAMTCPAGQFCSETRGACIAVCNTNADCDDHQWCNGVEVCTNGACGPGSALPCPSVAACDEALNQCTACTGNEHCDDGQYCNGREACGPNGTCIRGLLVPCSGRPCDESIDRCGCNTDAQCSDNQYCTGVERCVASHCVGGRAPCPYFVPGTSVPACNDTTDSCAPPRGCSTDAECSDGVFCNGAEVCAPGSSGADAWGCRAASTPACGVGTTCNEAMRRCNNACPTPDADGDGHMSTACGGDDCDDNDRNRYPGNAEVCTPGDLHDEDCDSSTVGSMSANDADNDGQISSACCNTRPGMPPMCGPDCDDARPDVRLGAAELCDARDNNCDGRIDEGVTDTRYLDADGDGAGAASCQRAVCASAAGYVANRNDCNDTDATLGPGAQQCGSGSDATEIWICGSGGVWSHAMCSGSQVCSIEPNGTGSCR